MTTSSAETHNEIFVDWRQQFGTISGLKAGINNDIIILREVIPIIFVPGIMGTALKQREPVKKKGKLNYQTVWNPNERIYTARNHIKKNPTDEELEVLKNLFTGEGEHHPEFLTVLNEDDESGFSNLYEDSYADLFKRLQNFPNAIDSEICRHCFDYPVSAFGYNWTASNAESGKQLKAYIEKVIDNYQQQQRECHHVILVTHSMGGLVAREACRLLSLEGQDAEKVLCVIHGAQPVHGAVSGYSQMKLGAAAEIATAPDLVKAKKKSGYFKQVLPARAIGSTGKAITVKMTRMPGALELLPTKRYTTNQGSLQWLHYVDKSNNQRALSLPKVNPYQEIYAEKNAFYRLVNPDWLEPWVEKKGGNKKTELVDDYDHDKAWQEYLKLLKKAEKFHDTLGDYQHPKTYQFYAKDLATVEQIEYGYVHVHAYDSAALVDEKWIVEQRLDRNNWFERVMLQLIAATGDGTVLRASARGLTNPLKTTRFDAENMPHWDSVEHQNLYRAESVIHYVLEEIEGESHARIRQECNLPLEAKTTVELAAQPDNNPDIWV